MGTKSIKKLAKNICVSSGSKIENKDGWSKVKAKYSAFQKTIKFC